MSHCSFLYTSDSDNPLSLKDTSLGDEELRQHKSRNEVEVIEVCGARVPFLWIAMFSSGDVYAKDVDYDLDDLDNEEHYLVFITTTDNAVANLKRRYKGLQSLIPDKYINHLDNFIARITRSSMEYIHVTIDDIEQMSCESMVERAKEWNEILKQLDLHHPAPRFGVLRYILGDGVSSSWKVVLALAGMDSGLIFLKLTEINAKNQYFISGGITANEILEWNI